MSVPTRAPQVIRFGVFEIDVEGRELRKAGTRLKIQEQPLQVLLLLLQHPGHVVGREEFRQQLWSADTFVDFDNGLNRSVARLRELLGDSIDAPRYIQTVARKGYRFICPVEQPETLAAAVPRVPPLEIQAPSAGRSMLLAWTAVILAVVAAVLIYALLRRPAPHVSSASARVTLAVLPFENLTGDPAQDYFSDGLTEEMITQLGGLVPDRLGVIARTSAMHYKGTTETAGQISRELKADYLLEGSVRREGSRVRISAQLIRARDQTHLWAQDYDRDLRDYLDLESEISRDVASQIEIKLAAAPAQPPRRALNPEAYEAYLKGRYFWNQRSESSYRKAIAAFEQAIALDPQYAQAYAGLADAYSLLGSNPSQFVSRQEAMRRARVAALKAVVLDDTLAEAHTSLAFIYWHYDWNWPAAEREFQHALLLNPSYPTAHHWHAFFLVSQGQLEQAVQEIRRAQESDPLSSIINTDVGEILFYDRQYDQAIAQERQTLEMSPDFILAWRLMAVAYLQKHDYEKALATMHRAMQIPGDRLLLEGTLGMVYAGSGQKQPARLIARRLEQNAERQGMEELYLAVAEIYSALHDPDNAMLWLEKAYQTRDGGLTLLQVLPVFDWLHSDPRFLSLLRRIGLPQPKPANAG